MNEIWKESLTYPGIMVSSWGRILLCGVASKMPNGGMRRHLTKPRFGIVTRSSKSAAHVYLAVRFKQYGTLKIHALVCDAFHGPRPTPSSVMIHKDENALNNAADNLRWGTQKENMNMPKLKAYHRSRVGENSTRRKGMIRG